MAGLQSGMVIGAPPLLNDAFTSDQVRKEVLPDILDGKKFIALAISEAFVGSDVRGMRTTAEKQSDGSFIVTGQKKWITGGSTVNHTYLPLKGLTSIPINLRLRRLVHDRSADIERWVDYDVDPKNG